MLKFKLIENDIGILQILILSGDEFETEALHTEATSGDGLVAAGRHLQSNQDRLFFCDLLLKYDIKEAAKYVCKFV